MENKQQLKLFYPDGALKYEGQTKKNDFGHDVYDGFGKLYDEEGHLLYEGEFVEQAKQGEGKMYLKGKLRYSGQFARNQKHGAGEFYQDDYLLYRGNFVHDQMDGYGELFMPMTTSSIIKANLCKVCVKARAQCITKVGG